MTIAPPYPRIKVLNLAPDWPLLAEVIAQQPDLLALPQLDGAPTVVEPDLVLLSLDQPDVWGQGSVEGLLSQFPALAARLITCQKKADSAALAKTLQWGGLDHWVFSQDAVLVAERLRMAQRLCSLRAEQQGLTAALGKVGVCFAALNSDLHYVAVNSAYANQVERSPALILGHAAPEVVPLELQEVVIPQMKQALQGQESRFQADRGGVFKEVLLAPRPQGGLWVLLQDYSELHREQQRLKLFQHMVDKSLDGIALVRKSDARFVDFNQRTCQLFGYNAEEMLDKSVLDIDAKLNGYEQWKAIADHTQAKGHALIETRGITKGGQTFPAEVASHYIEFEGQGHFVVVIRDISERLDQEMDARASRAELSSILRAYGDLYLWLDQTGRILGYQVTLFKAFGLPYENMIGNLIEQIFPSDVVAKIRQGIAEILQGHSVSAFHLGFANEKGAYGFDARLVPIRGNQILLLARNL